MIESTIILSDAVEEFFEAKQAEQISVHTLKEYGYTLNRFKKFIGPDTALIEITKKDIQKFINSFEGFFGRIELFPK